LLFQNILTDENRWRQPFGSRAQRLARNPDRSVNVLKKCARHRRAA
jgi:hypothetical protein